MQNGLLGNSKDQCCQMTNWFLKLVLKKSSDFIAIWQMAIVRNPVYTIIASKKRVMHCSRCFIQGHTARSCTSDDLHVASDEVSIKELCFDTKSHIIDTFYLRDLNIVIAVCSQVGKHEIIILKT